jgi:hypothetical protein
MYIGAPWHDPTQSSVSYAVLVEQIQDIEQQIQGRDYDDIPAGSRVAVDPRQESIE